MAHGCLSLHKRTFPLRKDEQRQFEIAIKETALYFHTIRILMVKTEGAFLEEAKQVVVIVFNTISNYTRHLRGVIWH